ncbi:hypothetical protein [Streptacidiphilus cavernicola]|uniref:Transcriptional regulator n=1 Tax=Streptacidiphilus cavernicola TaxID=3342716 RepID=A0ABV6W699_9ACTN
MVILPRHPPTERVGAPTRSPFARQYSFKFSSDVGNETLRRLERAFDELATAYPSTPPQELLERVRRHSAYVAHLLDAKKTLSEHRRLLEVGGWFSLLGATLHIDLKQEDAATARLVTAATLAQESEQDEIHAWCYETTAWRVLTNGDYTQAAELAVVAQSIAPKGFVSRDSGHGSGRSSTRPPW